MADFNIEAFGSGCFGFKVGSRHFTVHKILVSRVSDVLLALMENGMRESREGYATISDSDETSFARLVEFLYTGDYNAPQPSDVNETLPETIAVHEEGRLEYMHETNIHWQLHEEPAIPEPPPAALDADPWGFTSKKKKKQSRAISRLPDLELSAAITSPLPTCSEVNHESTEGNDYTAVFFCHAQLYVLADTYGVEPLKMLTRERLSKAFQHFRRSPGSVADITGLIKYVFEHTPESTEQPDVLQDICVHYAANSLETLVSSVDFRRLLRGGGSFVGMLVGRIAERLGQL
ncbi:hypothetical protein LTR15_004291 [Elasticomyces elasticus]|nr:hypothetical protein LTR15_004291 [Elasticomyces elasticus]